MADNDSGIGGSLGMALFGFVVMGGLLLVGSAAVSSMAEAERRRALPPPEPPKPLKPPKPTPQEWEAKQKSHIVLTYRQHRELLQVQWDEQRHLFDWYRKEKLAIEHGGYDDDTKQHLIQSLEESVTITARAINQKLSQSRALPDRVHEEEDIIDLPPAS